MLRTVGPLSQMSERSRFLFAQKEGDSWMSQDTRNFEKFEYYVEDMTCPVCLYYQGVKRGCSLDTCCCLEEKREAWANGRIRHKRGWNHWHG